MKEWSCESQSQQCMKDSLGFLWTGTWISTSIFGFNIAIQSLFHFLAVARCRKEFRKKEFPCNIHLLLLCVRCHIHTHSQLYSIPPKSFLFLLPRLKSRALKTIGKSVDQSYVTNQRRSRAVVLYSKCPLVIQRLGYSVSIPLLHNPPSGHPRNLQWRNKITVVLLFHCPNTF